MRWIRKSDKHKWHLIDGEACVYGHWIYFIKCRNYISLSSYSSECSNNPKVNRCKKCQRRKRV